MYLIGMQDKKEKYPVGYTCMSRIQDKKEKEHG